MIPSPDNFGDLGKQWLSNLSHTCFDETYVLANSSNNADELLDQFDGSSAMFSSQFPIDYLHDMNDHNNMLNSPLTYLRPSHEAMQGVSFNNHFPKKKITSINGSQYGTKPSEQSSYRNYGPASNAANIHQPTKSKNKSEWNFYINQAAAVGRNKPATIPTTVGSVPDHDNNWNNNNQNRRRSNGIEFNGLVHTKFHSNHVMRS